MSVMQMCGAILLGAVAGLHQPAKPLQNVLIHFEGQLRPQTLAGLCEISGAIVLGEVTALANADLENGAIVRTDYSISVRHVLKRDAHVNTAGDLIHVLRPGGGRDQGLHFTATLRPAS